MGSSTMEFRYLSKITGASKYEDAVVKAMDLMINADLSQSHGLFPTFIDLNTGVLTTSAGRLSLGAMADSFYEYLFKDWRYQGNHVDYNRGREPFDRVMRAANRTIIKRSPDGFTYLADLEPAGAAPKMEHLTCFMGGTLAMASQGAETPALSSWYLALAENITATCRAGCVFASLHAPPPSPARMSLEESKDTSSPPSPLPLN